MKTLAGETKEWWIAQIEKAFEIAYENEDIPFGILYLDLNYVPTEQDTIRASELVKEFEENRNALLSNSDNESGT